MAESALPVPRGEGAVTVVPAPGAGDGFWAGAPCVAVDPAGGGLVLGLRVRHGHDGVDEVVFGRSPDGVAFTPAVTLPATHFEGARWTERPALVALPGGGWRAYVCLGGPATKRWWIVQLDAPTLEALAEAEPRPVFDLGPGLAVKDPIVERRPGGWEAWLCCHLLDEPGAEDRMRTDQLTSPDGDTWTLEGTALAAHPGTWLARGARITAPLQGGRLAAFDGRASAAENWFERTGFAALGDDPAGGYHPLGDDAAFDARYLTVLPDPAGRGTRIWYEARNADLSHELRTELLPPG